MCSKIRTPRSSATRRRPRASSAGWTVAARASKTPARWRSEPARRATSSGLEALEGVDSRAARRARRRRPRRRRATASSPSTGSRRGGTGRRCRARRRTRRCASIACAEAWPSRSASSTPQSLIRLASFGHQDSTMPPLRPDAPPPQTSRSSTTTSHAGSRRLSSSAVHRPTKPPPRIATSARSAPASAGAGGPSRACCEPERTVGLHAAALCAPARRGRHNRFHTSRRRASTKLRIRAALKAACQALIAHQVPATRRSEMLQVGVDVGGTFTDLFAWDPEAGRVPPGEGALHARRPVGRLHAGARRRGHRGGRDQLGHPRHHDRHQRADRAPLPRAGAGHHAGLPRRAGDRPPAAQAPL